MFARAADDAALVKAAEETGLVIVSWKQCHWTDVAREAVRRDVEDGIRLGIEKTPSFLVGNRLLAGASAQSELAGEILRRLGEAPPK